MKLRLTIGPVLVALLLVPVAFANEPQAQLVDAIRVTIQGQPVIGGCQYEGTVTVLPGQGAVEQHELSENPITCTMEMEQGTPTGTGVANDGAGGVSRTVGTKATAARRPVRGSSTVSATTRSAGYSKTWVEDPLTADVNSVQNSIEWSWDDPYITPSSTSTCLANYWWLAATGWGRQENNLQCNYDVPSYPQSWVDSTSFVHYKNGVFCGFTDTHVYYDRNHAIGYGDGRLVGRWRVTKSGSCSGLLSVNNRTQRTMN